MSGEYKSSLHLFALSVRIRRSCAMDKRQFNIFCEILLFCLCVANQVEWIDAKRPKRWREKAIVKTAVGKVRGRVLETRLGEPFYAFRGMPYAQSPINKLRFKVRAVSEVSI